MASKMKTGLGKGLDSIFIDNTAPSGGNGLVRLSEIQPRKDQPRKNFDLESLQQLADSIAEHGLLQPVVVREALGGYYEIIAGERRWRAAKMAGLSEIPVTILTADDRKASELAIIENVQREDLNPMEEARGYAALISDFGMSQEETAKSVGKARTTVTNALRLLNLPKSIVSLVEDGSLSAGHARALLPLPSENIQKEAAQRILDQQLSVRQTEAMVKRLMKPQEEPEPENVLKVDYYRECEKTLSKSLGRGVKIHPGKKKGVFQLEYYGEDDLQQLIEALEHLRDK